MPDDLSIPRMPRKQIELWDITSTSGNFRPYQIQTANIHFKVPSERLSNEVQVPCLRGLRTDQQKSCFLLSPTVPPQ